MLDDKLIVTHRGALRRKYASGGFARIRTALRSLTAADRQRGLKTRLVFLDDTASMTKLCAPPVTDPASPRQFKAAIDAVFRTVDPDYLLILGAPDVVPMQDLANPIFEPPADPDVTAWGDLPYACDAAYSHEVSRFKGPTRVVGRLPDLTGATDPAHLIDLIEHAAAHRPREVAEFAHYFALSTATWKASTALSVFNVFGESKALMLSPPTRAAQAARRLATTSDRRHAPLMHFINCHGGQADPQFYGEDAGGRQPVSLTSEAVAGKIRPGTVAAFECCYGGELYDSVTLALPLPICQHYLAQGAAGVLGASTIAYGPVDSNGAADLLTQYFLLEVLGAASLGRAALMARQRFIAQTAELDPADLKTLAQFNLLGDPSLHPARVPAATATPQGVTADAAARMGRRGRRQQMKSEGEFLRATKPATSTPLKQAVHSPRVRQALGRIAQRAGLGAGHAFVSYEVRAPGRTASSAAAGGAKASTVASRYHVAIGEPGAGNASSVPSGAATGSAGLTPRRSPSAVAAVAREVGGRIVGFRVYVQR